MLAIVQTGRIFLSEKISLIVISGVVVTLATRLLAGISPAR